MKKIILLLLLLVGFILQSTIFTFITIRNVIPDIILALLVLISLRNNGLYGISLGLLMGVILDIFFGSIFGINSLILMTIGFVLGLNSDSFYKYDYYTFLILTILSTVFYNCSLVFIYYFLRAESAGILYFLEKIFLKVIINSALSYPIFLFYNYISKKTKIDFDMR